MSLVFNDTVTKKGIVQMYERECGFKIGDVSGNTERLKNLAADVNIAYDDFLSLAFEAEGTWQLDDSNFTDYPIITADIVSGQRDYPFTTDEQGNLILDIFKVMLADQNGTYKEIFPVDVQSQQYDTASFYDGQNATGMATKYDKTANALFLNLVPNYSYTNGLKMYVNREPSYFAYTDTTKKPGVPGLLHTYFYLHPALAYARRNTKANLNRIEGAFLKIEDTVRRHFSSRTRDERRNMSVRMESNK